MSRHTPESWGSSHLAGRLLRPRSTLRHRSCWRYSKPHPDRFLRQCSRRYRRRGSAGSTSRCSGISAQTCSRPTRMRGAPGSSRLSGRRPHRCSRPRYTPRRWRSTRRWCSYPQRCSMFHDKLAFPGNRWTRRTPGLRGSTHCRRQRIAGSTWCRRGTFRRTGSNRYRSLALRDSRHPRGTRYPVRNRFRHRRFPWDSTPAWCSAAPGDSTHPGTAGREGNMRR